MNDPYLLSQLIERNARLRPDAVALIHKDTELTYAALWRQVLDVAAGCLQLGLAPSERVAVYLPKQVQTVTALFGASAARGVFVPVNPILKPAQVGHILRDCNVRVLVTSVDRASLLAEELARCHDLRHLVLVDGDAGRLPEALRRIGVAWDEFVVSGAGDRRPAGGIDADMAAILYTSGSTGRPKGVVLSHRNMMAGARSVAEYLENRPADRLLAVLPFSFDYGLSQLTTAFVVGACVVLFDYLLPRDVIKAVAKYAITGLAAVPPLWNQLAQLPWPDEARAGLRYMTNSGGAMPKPTTAGLRAALPNTRVYLMYGLTEAFRSTYLDPGQVDVRPESMGKAIPNAEVMVVRDDGTPCAPGEPGELVHRGALVALGYWNDPAKTAERFKPAPGQPPELCNPEIAVWSGDRVRRDEEGYLYFVARNDEMIKTSGYRVSPTEIEEVVYTLGGVEQAVAFGAAHAMLGQGVVLIVQAAADSGIDDLALAAHCRKELPNFMVPGHIEVHAELPRNPNGKLNRSEITRQYADVFKELP